LLYSILAISFCFCSLVSLMPPPNFATPGDRLTLPSEYCLQSYTESQPRRSQQNSSLQWEFQPSELYSTASAWCIKQEQAVLVFVSNHKAISIFFPGMSNPSQVA
jgi:hypothetical protein